VAELSETENLPTAVIRRTPTDFVVEELAAYEASGQGEHLFVTIRKTGRTTIDVVRELARGLDIDDRGAGYAGLKDRHAVTTQTLSMPFPIARDPGEALAAISIEGVEILEVKRHDNKLKPGHLLGNRFRLTLRDCAPDRVAEICRGFEELAKTGVPNSYGPQRFGRDGDNPQRALEWLSGKSRGPRDKRTQRLWFSALQSLMFNRLLEQREGDGTWSTVLGGDLAKKHDSGGLFIVPEAGAEHDDAVARAGLGQISATGPMFGAKMRWPEGAVADMERAVVDSIAGGIERFQALRHLGQGTRRTLRIMPSELNIRPPQGSEDGIALSFVLPKGGYATTVLGRVCRIIDATRVSAPAEVAAPDQQASPEGEKRERTPVTDP